jgi:hypothetical protein
VEVSLGLLSIGGDQRKGTRDDELIVTYFSVVGSSVQGMKWIGTGATSKSRASYHWFDSVRAWEASQ